MPLHFLFYLCVSLFIYGWTLISPTGQCLNQRMTQFDHKTIKGAKFNPGRVRKLQVEAKLELR